MGRKLTYGLWRRIGPDGLPPLARDLILDDEVVAEIVDLTSYNDFGEEQPLGDYEVRWAAPDAPAPRFPSAEAAVAHVAVACRAEAVFDEHQTIGV